VFGEWLGLPFPLFDGGVPASVVAFAAGFGGYLGLVAMGRFVSRGARWAAARRS
jgi:hypothetical protein